MQDRFHRITAADRERLERFFEQRGTRLCNDSAGAALLWSPYYEDAVCEFGGTLLLRERFPGVGTVYLPPRADDDAAYAFLEAEAEKRGERLLFFPVSAEDAEALRVRYPEAEITPLRDWYDYLYNAADMAGFPGKRFHGQRSHVNKFDRLYPDWRFEAITAENLPDVRAYFEDHAARYRKDDSETALAEEGCVRDFLAHYDAYGGAPMSGVLYVGDRVIGFSCGEVVGDTLIIHIEKGDIEFDGVYQKLVCEYAKRYVTGDVRYINREEDLGDPGMRQSKEQYHPVALLEKYLVSLPLEGKGDREAVDEV